MLRFIKMTTLIFTMLMLASCAESKADKIKVAVVNRTFQDSVYVYMEEASKNYAAELGNVDIVWQSSDFNIAHQKDYIENFINLGYDIIVIEAYDTDSMVTTAKKAQDAGIKVITFEQQMNNFIPSLHITGNNYELGKMQVENFIEVWGTEKPAVCALLAGTAGDEAAESIAKGVRETAAKYPNLVIEFDQYVLDWDREKAMRAMEDCIIKCSGNVNVVFANNDNIGLGAYKAAKNAGIDGSIVIYAGDNDKETAELILSGAPIITIDRSSVLQGKRIVEAAVKAYNGDEFTYDVIVDGIKIWHTPLTLINSKNVEEFTKIKYPELF